MLRRLIDGALLTVLAWFVIVRLDASQVVLGLAIAAVMLFTGWRVHRLWRKYKHLLAELAAAEEARLSDDPKEVERAERILRSRRMMRAADMSLLGGFVLGSALSDGSHSMYGGGDMDSGYDGGDSAGGFGGGDMGGGGFDGGM